MRMAGNSAVTALMADMGGPDFTGMSNLGQKARTEEGMQAMKSNAEVDLAHMAGDAAIAKADMQADVYGAMGQAAQQQQMGSMIGQLGGSLGSMFGGLGTTGAAAPATTGFNGMSGVDILKNPNIGYNVGTASTPAFRGNLFGGG